MQVVARLPQLNVLDLNSRIGFDKEALAPLSLAKQLRTVNLQGRISVAEVRDLSKVKGLLSMSLYRFDDRMSPEIMDAVAQLPIKVCDLSHGDLTRDLLSHLYRSKTLEFIKLTDCGGVSRKDLRKFREGWERSVTVQEVRLEDR